MSQTSTCIEHRQCGRCGYTCAWDTIPTRCTLRDGHEIPSEHVTVCPVCGEEESFRAPDEVGP